MKSALSWKIMVVVALFAAIAITVGSKSRSGSMPEAVASNETPAASPVAGAKKLPRLLELGSEKCVPCRMMIPVLASLRRSFAGQLQVDFIDVWQDRKAGETYRIDSIPTQIFFDAQGRELTRHVGFYSEQQILATFKKNGVTLQAAPSRGK